MSMVQYAVNSSNKQINVIAFLVPLGKNNVCQGLRKKGGRSRKKLFCQGESMVVVGPCCRRLVFIELPVRLPSMFLQLFQDFHAAVVVITTMAIIPTSTADGNNLDVGVVAAAAA
jgi:hypothetical protein